MQNKEPVLLIKEKKLEHGVRPFLKWAGGKRWLVDNYSYLLSDAFRCHRYIEPFLGSGAAFFYICPASAILSDYNGKLINAYEQIRKDWTSVYKHLKKFHRKHTVEFYYKMRSKTPHDDCEDAALFIYFNRTCFNGLYRVNKLGQFNVPIGTKKEVIYDFDDFAYISKILGQAKLHQRNYEETIERAEKGDFCFIDPPYTVKHNNNGFIKYNEKIYSWEDQVKLAHAVDRLNSRGVKYVVTNANSACIRDLYKEICSQYIVERASIIASKSDRRGTTSELVLTNIKIDSRFIQAHDCL